MSEIVNIVEVKALKKAYGKSTNFAVYDLSLNIKEGEILGLVGESGCGKSTLGKLMLKLIKPTGGEIWFDGNNITNYSFKEMRKLRMNMQIIFQGSTNAFNPYYTVRQIMSEPLNNYTKFTNSEKDNAIISMLESVGLSAYYLDRYSGELSGGQRQRIGIARALILNPKFVVCDEVVSSIDYVLKKQILKILYDFKQKNAFTYLFISHDMSAVNAVCDRIAVMYFGNIVEIIPNINTQGIHPYTIALLNATLESDPTAKKEKKVLFKEAGEFTRPQKGCVFQSRCLYARDICKLQSPQLLERSDGHFIACHLF